MSYQKRKLRVFLSSSMAEFPAHRTAVKQELDSLRIPNFVFEKEGASDQAPEEIFRSAVQGASVYIGVFGKVYGRYTRDEYEMARAQKIACHLYVQSLKDEDRSEELKSFLQNLSGVSDVPTVYYFHGTDELVRQIKRDLWKWRDDLVRLPPSKEDRIDIRDNLPVLCDRDPQEIAFDEQIAGYFQVRSTRPLLLILPGPVEEKHSLYVDRVKLWSLEEYLNKAGLKGDVKLVKFRKSPCAMTAPAHLRREILGLIQEQETGDDRVIVEYIRKAKLKALVIVVTLLATECGGNPHKPLEIIADFLAGFPDTPERVLMSLVVCLGEDIESRGWWKRWLGAIQKADSTRGLFDQHVLELQQQYRDDLKVRVEMLPRLHSPIEADLRRWLDLDLVKEFLPHVPEEEIKAIFHGRDSLPMSDLYPKLSDLLDKRTA
jgi:hypothetical protein